MNLRFITGIVLILSLFAGCSKERKADPISKNQWKILSYLPQETYYLFYMNAASLNNTSFLGKYLKNQMKDKNTSNWLSDIQNKTGLGLKRGIKELYVSNSWGGNNAAIITFNNPEKKLTSYLTDEKQFIKKGSYFIKIKDPSSFYFLPDDSTLMIYSDLKYIDQVVSGNNSNIKSNKDFMKILGDISFKKQYWFAANQNVFAYTLVKRIFGSAKGRIESIIKNIKYVAISAEFNNEVYLESNWGCKEPEDALMLSGAIKTALSMDLLPDINPEVNKILKKTEINREGNKVSLNLNLNNNDINEMRKLVNNFPGNKL